MQNADVIDASLRFLIDQAYFLATTPDCWTTSGQSMKATLKQGALHGVVVEFVKYEYSLIIPIGKTLFEYRAASWTGPGSQPDDDSIIDYNYHRSTRVGQ